MFNPSWSLTSSAFCHHLRGLSFGGGFGCLSKINDGAKNKLILHVCRMLAFSKDNVDEFKHCVICYRDLPQALWKKETNSQEHPRSQLEWSLQKHSGNSVKLHVIRFWSCCCCRCCRWALRSRVSASDSCEAWNHKIHEQLIITLIVNVHHSISTLTARMIPVYAGPAGDMKLKRK